MTNHTDRAKAIAAELAHEFNGGDRADSSYPKEWIALMDDCSIANEKKLADWFYAIISRHLEGQGDVRPTHYGSSRHPHFTHEDHQRMQETLDSLSECPTEEEAEAALQACGTSGKEVVNGFIERLLRERSTLFATGVAACVEKVKAMGDEWQKRMEDAGEGSAVETVMSSRSYAAYKIKVKLESLTDSAPSGVVLIDREEAARVADSWEDETKVNPARAIASGIRQLPAYGAKE